MKLFIDSIFLSAASTNDRTPDDETPCDSGLLRGRSPAMASEPLMATSTTTEAVFMLWTRKRVDADQFRRGPDLLRSGDGLQSAGADRWSLPRNLIPPKCDS